MRPTLPSFACAVVFSLSSLPAAEPTWTPLWNGVDLAGWDTYLAKPHATVKLPHEERNAKGEHTAALGLNHDPHQVFSIVTHEGAPAIRVSGEIFGTITTKATYSNYHLKVEMQWGERRWAPRTEQPRDSGILYHAAGAWGTVGAWLPSLELQIQEGDVGDFWAVNARALVHARPFDAKEFVYDPAAPLKLFAMGMPNLTRRVLKRANYEKPRGEWNVIEVVCLGDKSWHVVNGHVVLALENLERNDAPWTPATSGHIQLQSEGAELFYRKIMLRPITVLPAQFQQKD